MIPKEHSRFPKIVIMMTVITAMVNVSRVPVVRPVPIVASAGIVTMVNVIVVKRAIRVRLARYLLHIDIVGLELVRVIIVLLVVHVPKVAVVVTAAAEVRVVNLAQLAPVMRTVEMGHVQVLE